MITSDTPGTPPVEVHGCQHGDDSGDQYRERGQHRFWRFFPLVWLGYLFFPVRSFLSHPHSVAETLLSGLGLLLFLGVWVDVYLFRRGQVRLLLSGFAVCLLLYAAGLQVIGYDSATFLVYAAALIGFQGSLRLAGGGLLLVAAALLIPGWLGHTHLNATDLTQIMILSCVAMYGNQAGYRQGVATMRLTRMQAEKEKLAADAERERIARDLHDLLGHTLSVIVLKSELAGKLAERDPARAFAEIREVERIARGALGEVRSAVSGYRGSGLSAELARSKLALTTAGVRLELDAEPLALPPQTEYAMEMVLREAVTNVMRHARAGVVTVSIGRQAGSYVLKVHDDGAGHVTGGQPAGKDITEGTGLTSMRERVRAAGGQFSLENGHGMTVRASFPIRPETPSSAARTVTA